MDQSKKQQNVVDFVDKLKSQKELQEYARAQFATILKAQKRIEELETENQALKAVPPPSINDKAKPFEEVICELEISKLHQKSMLQTLNIEEVKKLEILVKTLNVIKKRVAEEQDKEPPKPATVDEATLLSAASSEESE